MSCMMNEKGFDMGWLDEVEKIYNNQVEFERTKPFRLTVKSENDIPENLGSYKVINFFSDYKGAPLEKILPGVLKKAYDLDEINILAYPVTWEFICSLELKGITSIAFSLRGVPSHEELHAVHLRKLKIFGDEYLTPIELMLRPYPHLNLSGLDSLEILELRHLQQVDPSDFKNISSLKKIVITDADILNLNWLKEASYQLDSLYIQGPLENCEGITSQPLLKELALNDTCISNILPIETLQNLKKLDLRYIEGLGDNNLRSMGIESVLINHFDQDLMRIRDEVQGLSRKAVIHYLGIKKAIESDNDLPQIKRILYQDILKKPYEEVIKDYIQQGFDHMLNTIDNNHGFTITKDERRDIFIDEAMSYYPFLKKK